MREELPVYRVIRDRREPDRDPYQELCKAVIESAMKSLKSWLDGVNGKRLTWACDERHRRRNARGAWLWMTQPMGMDEGGLPFLFCCDALGWNPHALVEGFKRLRTPHERRELEKLLASDPVSYVANTRVARKKKAGGGGKRVGVPAGAAGSVQDTAGPVPLKDDGNSGRREPGHAPGNALGAVIDCGVPRAVGPQGEDAPVPAVPTPRAFVSSGDAGWGVGERGFVGIEDSASTVFFAAWGTGDGSSAVELGVSGTTADGRHWCQAGAPLCHDGLRGFLAGAGRKERPTHRPDYRTDSRVLVDGRGTDATPAGLVEGVGPGSDCPAVPGGCGQGATDAGFDGGSVDATPAAGATGEAAVGEGGQTESEGAARDGGCGDCISPIGLVGDYPEGDA